MNDLVDDFFASNFMPHGHCYFWTPEILWSQAISNFFIALAYCAIPLTLTYIFKKRNDVKFIWMMILFAIFILGCGITHVFDIIVIWNPLYGMDSIFRIITALASIGTAIVLIKITPSILKIPTAQQWINVNLELNEQIKQLKEKDKTIETIREFEFLANFIPQMIWRTQANGDHEYFNKIWYNYTGLSFEATKNTGWSHVLHPDDYDRTMATWQRCLKTGDSYEIEYRLRKHDGTYRWFLGRALSMKNEANEVIKWFGTCTDIQDQKTYNENLQAKNRELEIINNDLDNFVYSASHDLKSPITNLEGLFSLLKTDPNEKRNEETSRLIKVSLSRLKNTITELGEISKIQNELTVEEIVNLPEIYSDIMQDLDSEATQNQAIFEANFVVDEVHFSKKNMQTLIYNLLSNALKYRSPERVPSISIATYMEGNHLIISVKDNGLGISSKDKEKIFGMFKRLHDHVEGSGVGLYIVKKIVDNYGGKIDVKSVLNQWTEFKIYLPLKDLSLVKPI